MTANGGVGEWLALRRASRGGLARTHGGYVDGGHPIPADLAEILPALVDAGHVALAPTDDWGVARASLTVPSGARRLAELAEQFASAPSVFPCRAGAPVLLNRDRFDTRAHPGGVEQTVKMIDLVGDEPC